MQPQTPCPLDFLQLVLLLLLLLLQICWFSPLDLNHGDNSNVNVEKQQPFLKFILREAFFVLIYSVSFSATAGRFHVDAGFCLFSWPLQQTPGQKEKMGCLILTLYQNKQGKDRKRQETV